jgi:hypothetical protein
MASYREHINFDTICDELQEFAEFIFKSNERNVKLYILTLNTIKDIKGGLEKNMVFDNFLIQMRRLSK